MKAVVTLLTILLTQPALATGHANSASTTSRPYEDTVECPEFVKKIFKELKKMRSQKSPWIGVDLNNLPLGFMDSSDEDNPKIFLIGYDAKDYRTAGTKARRCSNIAGAYQLENPKDLLKHSTLKFIDPDGNPSEEFGEGVGFYYPENYHQYVKKGSGSALVNTKSSPLTVVDINVPYDELPEYLAKILKTPEMWGLFLLHESFHAIQEKHQRKALSHERWKKIRTLDFAETCQNDAKFIESLENEFRDWKTYLAAKSDGKKKEDLKKLLKKIVDRRNSFEKDSTPRKCWDYVTFQEVAEGTAHYFAITPYTKAGYTKFADPRSFWEDKNLSASNTAVFTEGSDFPYSTGFWTAQALTDLVGEKTWQKEIESGKLLNEILGEAVKD